MRVPLSWLREHVDIPTEQTGREVAERLVAAGFEVDSVERAGDVTGPVVTGRVLEFVAEPQRNGKTIRWCQVAVTRVDPEVAGEGSRGIVCGADNFAPGDVVVVALPGAVLPGGFAIGARKTYGHISDGMICSARELGAGDEHDGILVLPPDTPLGVDAVDYLGLRDEVLDVVPTPDRGYALSVRGLARELATAYAEEFRDPAEVGVESAPVPAWSTRVEDPTACPRFVARAVTGLDPQAPSPQWLQRRLALCAVRSVGLAVDITNYVMLELGQPLHAYDRDALRGSIVVRRAGAGETVETLDGTKRVLDPDDLVIADDSGAIGVAGVMGGAATEISGTTTAIVIEAAHFAPAVVSRGARRHGLLSEASRRFERGVDPALPPVAAQRAVDLLVSLGGAQAVAGVTDEGNAPEPVVLRIDADLPRRIVGVAYTDEEIAESMEAVGCGVEVEEGTLLVEVPSWRLDLRDPFDLVEEVARLQGYARIPSVLPVPPAGAGLPESQRALRRVGRAMAAAGLVEAPSYPFVGEAVFDLMRLPANDARRRTMRLANPLSEAEPLLRTTLLPGLFAAARRNLGRGRADIALYETGLVFRVPESGLPPAPVLPVDRRPSAAQLAELDGALPAQPRRLAVVVSGLREQAGWWGQGREVSWADAVELARIAAAAAGCALTVSADTHAPWHPGRCAALCLGAVLVGHAGELDPRVVAAVGLPPRSVALELDLDALVEAGVAAGPLPAPTLSHYPVATSDVALVVAAAVPAAAVLDALRAGAGDLLERLRLFDTYVGPGLPVGTRSLAFRLWFRAPNRTLTTEEVNSARQRAVAEAARRVHATLRT